ncbi:MAG TPA: hypothetical protein VGR82_18095 [Methylomirabilota bacterium]|nr:hypothetical protein [Methylomirabilota bacterium]
MKKSRVTRPSVKAQDPDVILWRPTIVLATRIEQPRRRPPVTLAPAAAHPDATGSRFDMAILSLADASASLAARAVNTRARAVEAASARERVTATMAAYRLEASFDQVLTGTYRQVTALMEERGLA